MPRYSPSTYDDPDAPRLPWWGWVLLLTLGVGLLKLADGCQGQEPPPVEARPREVTRLLG